MKSAILLSTCLALMLLPSFQAAAQYSDPVYTVSTVSDVKYGEGPLASGPNLDLMMDVYTPVGSTDTQRPAIMMVHGGGWISGDKANAVMISYANYFVSRGFVAFSINYRLDGDGPPAPPQFWIDLVASIGGLNEPYQVAASHAAMTDTLSAVRFIRANANTYGVDVNRIFGLGGSAGAFNVLSAALDDPANFASGLAVNNPTESSALQLVLNFWGGLINLAEVDVDDPPVFTAHGTEDITVPFSASESLDTALAAASVPHVYYVLQGSGHSAWSATVDGATLQELALDFILEYGIGTGEGEGEGESECELAVVCPDLQAQGAALYAFLAANNLIPPVPWAEADLDNTLVGAPAMLDSFEVALVEHVICSQNTLLGNVAICTFNENRATVLAEAVAGLVQAAGGVDVTTAFASIGSEWQAVLAAGFNFTGTYNVITSGGKLSSEDLSPSGDYDGDGLTNQQEYNNVISQGGSMADYVAAATNPLLNGTNSLPIAGLAGLGALLSVLGASGVVVIRHRK